MRQPKLTAGEVKRKLLVIVDQGSVIHSWHSATESMPEGNVTTQDVEHLLETGDVSENAQWSTVFENWKYRIDGTDIEGEELTGIFVIFEKNLMVRIITVF